MTKNSLLFGTACLWLSFGLVSAVAQEAQQLPAPATAPAARDCSGLGCLFGSRDPGPRSDDAEAARARELATRAADDGQGAERQTKAVTPKPAKPAPKVVIAAEASEIARLKRLATAMPKERIKIVAVRGTDKAASPDFSVSTDLAPSRSEKAKLFTEQMHILATGAVRSTADLEGKVVSLGPDKSASQVAARKAFQALNIKVQETPLDVDNALDGLATGDIHAVVMLAPQPIERLKTVAGAGLHLVPWPENGKLPDGAVASTIDAAAYPGLVKAGETISAMGVDATLNISAKGAKQAAAKGFLKALPSHSEALAKRGFDLIKADLESRNGRFLASSDRP